MGIPAAQLEQRERLLDELAHLIALVGYGDFVFGPIVLPDVAHFPDEWRPDLAGARAMLARLMAYARLTGLPISLRRDGDPSWATDDGDDYQPPHRDAAAWFAGVNEFGTYLFGIREEQLDDPMRLAGLLAHETSHAWRFRRDIIDASTVTEERLTDLTSVFLGFGVLSANLSSLAQPELQRQGYLATFPLCFALGVQLALRNDPAEHAAVESALPQDQRVMVREIRTLWAADRPALATRLGLPQPASWERPAPLLRPAPARLRAAPRPGRDLVFRVAAPPVAAVGLGSLLLGCLAAASSMLWWPLLAPVLCTPLALLLRRDRCSGAECGKALPREATTCPSCGGRVVGRIKRLRDRDDAERAFLAADDEVSTQARELVRDLFKR